MQAAFHYIGAEARMIDGHHSLAAAKAAGVEAEVPAASVLSATPRAGDDGLVVALRATGVAVDVIGDARSIDRLEGAFRDAAELAVRT